MDGIINVLKPPGMTSFDVVAYLRGIVREKKIGHTGTLDPDAVGVLPVCIGKATKAIEYMVDKDKLYRAEMTLGVATDTQDSSGNPIRIEEVRATEPEIREAAASFIGRCSQMPPMYSAVRVGGKKLYELAREGRTVERTAREIEIYSLDVVSVEGSKVIFDVKCSKGTYIRTLCADIGERLGCGAHMSFLIRLAAGNFKIDTALTLEEIEQMAQSKTLGNKLMGMENVFEGFEDVFLNREETRKIANGAVVRLDGAGFKRGQLLRGFAEDRTFVSLCEVVKDTDGCFIKSKKLFI